MPEEYLSSEENMLDFIRTKLLEYEEAIDNPPNLSLISAKPDSSKKENSSSLRTWNDVSLVMKETNDYWDHWVDFDSLLSNCTRGIEEFPERRERDLSWKGYLRTHTYQYRFDEADDDPSYSNEILPWMQKMNYNYISPMGLTARKETEEYSVDFSGIRSRSERARARSKFIRFCSPFYEFSRGIEFPDGQTWKIKSRGKVSETLDHSNIGLEAGLVQLAVDGINGRGSTSKEISNPIALAPVVVTDALGCRGYTPWGSQGKNADPSDSSGGKGMFGAFPSPPGGVNVPKTKFDNPQDISIDILYDPNFKEIPMIPTNIKDGESIDDVYSSDGGKLAELVLGITGPAVYSLLVYALSNPFSLPLTCVTGANALGFTGSLIDILFRRKKRAVAEIAGKVGAIAAATGIILGMGMFLPEKYVWTSAIACPIPALAVLFA